MKTKSKTAKEVAYYTEDSATLNSILVTLTKSKEIQIDYEEMSEDYPFLVVTATGKEFWGVNQDYIDVNGDQYDFKYLSFGEFVDMVNKWPEVKRYEFEWNGHACTVTKDGITVGCQGVTWDDFRKVQKVVKFIANSEQVEISDGRVLELSIWEVYVEFFGQEGVTFSDLYTLINKIEEGEEKIK